MSTYNLNLANTAVNQDVPYTLDPACTESITPIVPSDKASWVTATTVTRNGNTYINASVAANTGAERTCDIGIQIGSSAPCGHNIHIVQAASDTPCEPLLTTTWYQLEPNTKMEYDCSFTGDIRINYVIYKDKVYKDMCKPEELSFTYGTDSKTISFSAKYVPISNKSPLLVSS